MVTRFAGEEKSAFIVAFAALLAFLLDVSISNCESVM
jgi:hypothetical protein